MITNHYTAEEFARNINDETLQGLTLRYNIDYSKYEVEELVETIKGIKTIDKKNYLCDAILDYFKTYRENVENSDSAEKDAIFNEIAKYIEAVEKQRRISYFCMKYDNIIETIQAERFIECYNGKYGYFQYHNFKYNMHYKFYECEIFDNFFCKRSNVASKEICGGFIAYLIYNYKKLETTQLYQSYKQIRFEEYEDEHRHDVDLHKRDLEQEFYKMHVTEEQKRIKNAKRVFEYLPTEEQLKIKSYVDNYFDYIKSFIKDAPKSASHKGLSGREVDGNVTTFDDLLRNEAIKRRLDIAVHAKLLDVEYKPTAEINTNALKALLVNAIMRGVELKGKVKYKPFEMYWGISKNTFSKTLKTYEDSARNIRGREKIEKIFP